MKAKIPALVGVLLIVGGCCKYAPTPEHPVVCNDSGIQLYGPKLSREDEAKVRELLNRYKTPYRVEILSCRFFQLTQEVLGTLTPSVARGSTPRRDVGLANWSTTGISSHSTVVPPPVAREFEGDRKTYAELKKVLCKYNGANPIPVHGGQ